MVIKRDRYIEKLINKKDNGMIKIITGVRRCGKSFLLFNLYYQKLLSIGIEEENIITISLEKKENEHLHNIDMFYD